MSKQIKTNIIKGLISSLLILVFVLSLISIKSNYEIKQLNNEIDNLKENDNLVNSNPDDLVVLTIVSIDNIPKSYFIDKAKNINIYSFLISTKDYSSNDFSTWNKIDYYFKEGLTHIDGLPKKYYDEYGYLQIGLQAIYITDDIVLYNRPIV